MADSDALVERSLQADVKDTFDRRVQAQANQLVEAFGKQEFDSPSFGVGLELELYGVDEQGRLTHLPSALFETDSDKELGKHNAELQTTPSELTEDGFAAQREQLITQLADARTVAARHDVELVLDSMWTIPPVEGTLPYLSEMTGEGGHPANMTPAPRYRAIDRDITAAAGGEVTIDVPGVTQSFPSILVESLTSSIQPHIQIPTVTAYPSYHNLALRTLGPVLALATNSPFLPVDLYAEPDPDRLLRETYHESRIPVFEQSINGAAEKVKFPRDVGDVTDVIDRLVADVTCAPFLREWVVENAEAGNEDFVDRFWEFDHKRGTYWRWLRAVIGGQPVGAGNDCSIRIEYRPLPTQPSIPDTVSLQALVAGLVRGLVATDHPLDRLPHDQAKRCFYRVVENGLDAELAWVDRSGSSTTDPAVIYDEMFSIATEGLSRAGLQDERIEELLAPAERRWATRRTPSQWKIDRVRAELDDGADFVSAVQNMQRDYIDNAGSGEVFVDW